MSTDTRYAAPALAHLSGSVWFSLLLAARPHQAIKNALLFFPLLFSHSLSQAKPVVLELLAFTAFTLVSSGIYILNDLCDIEADRRHPTKRYRPIAAGLISKKLAISSMLTLLLGGAVAAGLVNVPFQLVLTTYFLLNIGYSFGLKHVVILDAMIVALGFVLRAIAGSYAIDVPATHWLMLCTFMAALMLSFGKRYHELSILKDSTQAYRRTLTQYSERMLEMLVAMCGTSAIITYALYTTATDTSARFGSRNLLLTMPFVLFGVFRYLLLLYRHEGGDPARLFWRDRPIVLSAIGWVLVASLVIYGPLTRELF